MMTDPKNNFPSQKIKLLFLTNDEGSYITHDRESLKKHFDLKDFHHRNFSSFSSKLTYRIRSIFACDLVFAWFGSLEFLPDFLLARILNKKIIVVCAGFDVAYAPEIHHGAFTQNVFRRILRRFLFRLAHKTIPVSQFNAEEAQKNAHISPRKIQMISLGFPKIQTPLVPWEKRENAVCMIGHIDQVTVGNKGFFDLIKIAGNLPQIHFYHMGKISIDIKEQLKRIDLPQNLTLLGSLPYRSSEFFDAIQKSKIILQLSFYESFCASLIDGAMLGCFPIAWNRAALPETIAGLGITIENGDLKTMEQTLLNQIQTPHDVQLLARKAAEKFPMEKREQLLVKALIEQLE